MVHWSFATGLAAHRLGAPFFCWLRSRLLRIDWTLSFYPDASIHPLLLLGSGCLHKLHCHACDSSQNIYSQLPSTLIQAPSTLMQAPSSPSWPQANRTGCVLALVFYPREYLYSIFFPQSLASSSSTSWPQVARTGRIVTLAAPQRIFANERQTVQEGYSGDVIGLTNPGAFGECGARFTFISTVHQRSSFHVLRHVLELLRPF